MTDPADQTVPDEEEDISPPKPKRSRSRRPTKAAGDAQPADAQAGTVSDDGASQAATPPVQPPPPQVPPPPGSVQTGSQPYAAQIAADVPRPTFGQRVGKAIRRVVSWLIAALLGVLLGVLGFIYAPRLLEPIRANSRAIQRLETEVNLLGAQLTELKAEGASQNVELQAALLEAQRAAESRITETEARLAQAEARLRDAEDTVAEQARLIADLEDTLAETNAQLETLSARLAQLEEELPGVAEYAEYNRQLLLTRAWQEVLRARLRLLENNPGLAQDEIARARATLDQVYALSSAEQQAALDPVIERLEAVAGEITDNPFAATGDLEIAWFELGQLIGPPGAVAPSASPTVEATPAPETTPAP